MSGKPGADRGAWIAIGLTVSLLVALGVGSYELLSHISVPHEPGVPGGTSTYLQTLSTQRVISSDAWVQDLDCEGRLESLSSLTRQASAIRICALTDDREAIAFGQLRQTLSTEPPPQDIEAAAAELGQVMQAIESALRAAANDGAASNVASYRADAVTLDQALKASCHPVGLIEAAYPWLQLQPPFDGCPG